MKKQKILDNLKDVEVLIGWLEQDEDITKEQQENAFCRLAEGKMVDIMLKILNKYDNVGLIAICSSMILIKVIIKSYYTMYKASSKKFREDKDVKLAAEKIASL